MDSLKKNTSRAVAPPRFAPKEGAASGSAAFYQFDGSANTATVTGAGGAVLDAYTYLPFGEKLQSAGTFSNPFTYAGEVGIQDDGDGLYYMRARYYDPQIGRFTSEDPIGFLGSGTNFNAYVHNNPISLIDPTGMCENKWVKAGMYLGCAFGAEPDLVIPAEDVPKDSTDSPSPANGQRTLQPPSSKKSERCRTLNPEGENSGKIDGAVGGAALAANGAECVARVMSIPSCPSSPAPELHPWHFPFTGYEF